MAAAAASCTSTLALLILTVYSSTWTADGFPVPCSHSGKELGKCMTDRQCKLAGGVKDPNNDNSRCRDGVRSNGNGEDKVYCTTFAHLADDACSTWLPLWNQYDENCNLDNSVDFRIVGGERAEEGEFKHLAAVGKWDTETMDEKWECGGTLISPNYVLTAAHCVDRAGVDYRVRLGEYDFRQTGPKKTGLTKIIKMPIPSYLHGSSEYNKIKEDKTQKKQTLKVKRVILHPKFNRSISKNNDIALLEIITPVRLNENVLPACLPFDVRDDPKAGMNLTAAGWGSQKSGGKPANVVRKVDVPVVGTEKCEESYNTNMPTFKKAITITPELLCAGAKGLDTCQGDSGGPLGKPVSQPEFPCGAQVFGVVSFGYKCGSVGIYTRVSSYLNWIMRYLAPDHYHQHISERIHSTGLEFDGSSSIQFRINEDIFAVGFRIQLYFKTEIRKGNLITIPTEGSSFVLRMKGGKVLFRESLGNVTISSENSYNNGEWHQLTVECRPSLHYCYLKIADESLEEPWTLPSTLEVDRVKSLVVGGNTDNSFYKGSLIYSLSSSLKLRIIKSSNGTVTACDSSKPEHLEEDQDAADRELLYLEHLSMKQKMIKMEQLLQDMSTKMIDIQNFTLLRRDASPSAPKYTKSGCQPPFIVMNSTEECLFFGKVPLTLYEAKTTCQIMGGMLATPGDLAKLRDYMRTHALKVWHWVDGSDIKHGDGTFTWSNGEAIHADCWDTRYPKSTNLGDSCLQFNPEWEGYRNTHCGGEHVKGRYICKNTDIGGFQRAASPKCT